MSGILFINPQSKSFQMMAWVIHEKNGTPESRGYIAGSYWHRMPNRGRSCAIPVIIEQTRNRIPTGTVTGFWQPKWAMKKKTSCSGYIGDDTTHLNVKYDFHHEIRIPSLNNMFSQSTDHPTERGWRMTVWWSNSQLIGASLSSSGILQIK